MHVDFLMRVVAEEMGRDVARDHHHGNGIQRRGGHPGGGIGQAGPQWLSSTDALRLDAGIAVGGMGRDLLMARIDELDRFCRSRSASRYWYARTGPKNIRTPRCSRYGPAAWKRDFFRCSFYGSILGWSARDTSGYRGGGSARAIACREWISWHRAL